MELAQPGGTNGLAVRDEPSVGVDGSGPPISVSPSVISFSCSASSHSPFSAMWMISAPASVSWSWITSTSSGPTSARSYAAFDASTVGAGCQ